MSENNQENPGTGAVPLECFVIRILKFILFVPAGLYEIFLLVLAGLLIPFVHFKFTKESSQDVATAIINHAHKLPGLDWYLH